MAAEESLVLQGAAGKVPVAGESLAGPQRGSRGGVREVNHGDGQGMD